MRKIFILFSIFICANIFGQDAPMEDTSVVFVRIKTISIFVDSLRSKILSDTLQFNQNDIVETNKGSINTHSYSPLFFINILYLYKLDIVNSSQVLSFIDEFLDPGKIESIALLSESQSIKKFGANGRNGVVIILMKENAKVNFNVAGFKMTGPKGNNFFQPK